MKFKYNELEVSKNVELDLRKIKNHRLSILSSVNLDAAGENKIYPDITDEDVEMIAENAEEEEILKNDGLVDAEEVVISTATSTLISNTVQEALEELAAAIRLKQEAGVLGWKMASSKIEANYYLGESNPFWVDMGNEIFAAYFSDNRTQEAYIQFSIPRDYKLGTPIYPNIHWAPDSSSIGTVDWKLEYNITKGHTAGESFFSPTTSISLNGVGTGTAGEHIITHCNDVDAFSATEYDSIVCMKIKRDGRSNTDTFIGSSIGLSVGFYYQSDAPSTSTKIPV